MKPTREEMQELVNEIILLKYKAGKLGMYKTMQALEEGVTKVGWEMAEKLTEQERSCSNCKNSNLLDFADLDSVYSVLCCNKDDKEVNRTDCCLNWEAISDNIKNFYS